MGEMGRVREKHLSDGIPWCGDERPALLGAFDPPRFGLRARSKPKRVAPRRREAVCGVSGRLGGGSGWKLGEAGVGWRFG